MGGWERIGGFGTPMGGQQEGAEVGLQYLYLDVDRLRWMAMVGCGGWSGVHRVVVRSPNRKLNPSSGVSLIEYVKSIYGFEL